jgi:hypothetical protein
MRKERSTANYDTVCGKAFPFSSCFESAIIVWLQENSLSTVAVNFNLDWDAVDGIIMYWAVKLGLSHRKVQSVENFELDKMSYQKGHSYVKVILNKDRDCEIDVLNEQKSKILVTWHKT